MYAEGAEWEELAKYRVHGEALRLSLVLSGSLLQYCWDSCVHGVQRHEPLRSMKTVWCYLHHSQHNVS